MVSEDVLYLREEENKKKEKPNQKWKLQLLLLIYKKNQYERIDNIRMSKRKSRDLPGKSYQES